MKFFEEKYMRQRRGRRSAASLSVVTIDAIQRPKPPESMSEAGKKLWRDTVKALKEGQRQSGRDGIGHQVLIRAGRGRRWRTCEFESFLIARRERRLKAERKDHSKTRRKRRSG